MDEVLKIKCIPNNDEKYISFSLEFELKRIKKWDFEKKDCIEIVLKHEIRFLDSFKFTLAGLESLVKNLSLEDMKETTRFFGEKIDLVSRKGIYPYEYMDDFEKIQKAKSAEKNFFLFAIEAGKSQRKGF